MILGAGMNSQLWFANNSLFELFVFCESRTAKKNGKIPDLIFPVLLVFQFLFAIKLVFVSIFYLYLCLLYICVL